MKRPLDMSEFVRARLLFKANHLLSRESFERVRLRRFRKFAAFIKKNSPYYRHIMLDHRIDPATCTPESFPILTKSELIHNFNDIITVRNITYEAIGKFLQKSTNPDALFRDKYVIVHTSGSSGEVGYFIYGPKDWARAIAGLSRARGFNLFKRERMKVGFIGATQGHFAGVTSASAIHTFPLTQFYDLRTFEVNKPLREAIVGLNEFQPDAIVGYATALRALAEKQLEGELHIKPQVLTNSGEPMTAAIRQVVEKAFGKCLRNFYVSSEHMFMGLKEPSHESMGLFEDDLFFEIEPDHTLVTNISNHTLPLVRYRMTDILTPRRSNEHAPYRSIAEVSGRTEQVAKFKNRHGDIDGINPITIVEILIPNVKQFQMRIHGPEYFEFAVVLEKNMTAEAQQQTLTEARQKLSSILLQKEMDNVRFEVVQVNELPVDSKTGKYRLILTSSPA